MADKIYLTVDPFPSIPPALLNSADIADYVEAIGMIEPFNRDKLKPASYEVDLIGEGFWWSKDGKKHTEVITRGSKYSIRKNSIVFVCPAAQFKLPSYIALRFNLIITMVHRGLLLGTGPLVDPGFEGRLLIPLHNLTSEDYVVEGGSGLIWVEFTKLSDNQLWSGVSTPTDKDRLPRNGVYKPFPEEKKHLPSERYFFQASPHAGIASYVPTLLEEAQSLSQQARKTSKDAEDVLRNFRRIGILVALGTAIAVGYGFYSLLGQVTGLVSDANTYVNTLRKDMDVTERKLDEQLKMQKKNEEKIDRLEEELNKLKSDSSRIDSKVGKPAVAGSSKPQ